MYGQGFMQSSVSRAQQAAPLRRSCAGSNTLNTHIERLYILNRRSEYYQP